MSDDEKTDDPGIYKMETIPPPAGEDDAYSAPTRVGPMADAAVRELMQAAERRANELVQRNADKAKVAAEAAGKPLEAGTTPPAPMRGPVTGRAPAAVVGPVGRPASALPSAKPVGPKPPRPTTARGDENVRRGEVGSTPLASAPPPKKVAEAPADDITPPRMYDDSDESDDAATLLHASARPPSLAPLRQEHTAPLPSARPSVPPAPRIPVAVPVPVPVPVQLAEPIVPARPREPIPFERPPSMAPGALVAEDDESQPRILIMPLVVGFLIFAIGLAFYVWAR